MKKDDVIKVLKEYLSSSNTKSSIQLKGDWGVGKTYLITECLAKDYKDILQIRVSLFGIKEVSEISYKILNAYVNAKKEKGENVYEDICKGLDYIDFKYGQSRILHEFDLHDEDEIIFSIIPKNKVYICLDDVERFIKIDNEDTLLGYINNLSENLGYKVILIYNDHFKRNDNEEYSISSQFKEKVIGETVLYEPNVKECFDNFIGEYKGINGEFVTFFEDNNLHEYFLPESYDRQLHKGLSNLRNLRFALSNYEYIYRLFIDSRIITNNDIQKDFLVKILPFVIGVSVENKKNKLTDESCCSIDENKNISLGNSQIELYLGEEMDPQENNIEFDSILSKSGSKKEDESKRKEEEKDYSKKFYDLYIKKWNIEAFFYPQIYDYITSKTAIDIQKLMDLFFEYYPKKEENTGKKLLDEMNNKEYNDDLSFKKDLEKLWEFAKKGDFARAEDFVNAVFYFQNFESLLNLSQDSDMKTEIKIGVDNYFESNSYSNVEHTIINNWQSNNGADTSIKWIIDYISNKIEEKHNDYMDEQYENICSLFSTDMKSFYLSFYDEYGFHVSDDLEDKPILNMIIEDKIKEKVKFLTPEDIKYLSLLLDKRYCKNSHVSKLSLELNFLTNLNTAVDEYLKEQKNKKTGLTYWRMENWLSPKIKKALQSFNNTGNSKDEC
ncbi:MAG: hypothetical protein J6Y11_02255 [Paludibacteraceae bacterium]|nr:hypothetical protein [Paludibacteraceae bacterium]